jgi:hypothetical protein
MPCDRLRSRSPCVTIIHGFVHRQQPKGIQSSVPFSPGDLIVILNETCNNNNNNDIYLVWPQRGTWLHRTSGWRAACGVAHAKYSFTGVG